MWKVSRFCVWYTWASCRCVHWFLWCCNKENSSAFASHKDFCVKRLTELDISGVQCMYVSIEVCFLFCEVLSTETGIYTMFVQVLFCSKWTILNIFPVYFWQKNFKWKKKKQSILQELDMSAKNCEQKISTQLVIASVPVCVKWKMCMWVQIFKHFEIMESWKSHWISKLIKEFSFMRSISSCVLLYIFLQVFSSYFWSFFFFFQGAVPLLFFSYSFSFLSQLGFFLSTYSLNPFSRISRFVHILHPFVVWCEWIVWIPRMQQYKRQDLCTYFHAVHS